MQKKDGHRAESDSVLAHLHARFTKIPESVDRYERL